MQLNRFGGRRGVIFLRRAACAVTLGLAACTGGAPPPAPSAEIVASNYVIGPGDTLGVFVWRNPELSVDVTVRPDGRVSLPLVEDVVAAGKTPSQLAREIEGRLAKYISSPIVTVQAKQFIGPFDRQIRIIGEAVQPKALPYRAHMTLLDAMIEVGGLTRFAAGDRATLVRTTYGTQNIYSIHIDSLIRDGDIQANVPLSPGDIIIIPQRFF
jgi:polysaccharide biosynthesis/export protein